jgi:hypothetical protein
MFLPRLQNQPQPPGQIKPCKLEAALVGLRLMRTCLDFLRKKDGIQRFFLKTPDMTIEATRRRS